MNVFASRRAFFAGPGLALVVAAFTMGCTHEFQVTPAFQRSLAQLPDRAICGQNESLTISVVNRSSDPMEAGQVKAGFHTFNHHFAQDPAMALEEGLTTALRDGHCGVASPATADLQVVLVRMEAHGLTCGFVTCDGTAEAEVSVTLKDASGRVLSQQIVSTKADDSCGMTFCNEEESSTLATQAISEAVGKTVVAISSALAKRPPPQPLAAGPRPGS